MLPDKEGFKSGNTNEKSVSPKTWKQLRGIVLPGWEKGLEAYIL